MSSPASPDPGAPRRAELERAYIEACLLELRALKPGNVHVHAGGHRMSVAAFETSARVSAPALCAPGLAIGERILEAVRATRAAVGCNTNLGIVLLAAPLLAAAEQAGPGALRSALESVLARLTVADAAASYEAIRHAAPAGLGQAPAQDVARPPSVTLRQAMSLAASLDRIARQYASSYVDVFTIGAARLALARRAGRSAEWGATLCYLDFLATFPDSHVARKFGRDAAEALRAEAARLAAALGRADETPASIGMLLDFDCRLKRDGINPGTSADLTVASLLALACEDVIRRR
jgi:triphosphoribosyl-dephospho-CoA synthase